MEGRKLGLRWVEWFHFFGSSGERVLETNRVPLYYTKHRSYATSLGSTEDWVVAVGLQSNTQEYSGEVWQGSRIAAL